jgi:hypothetical protein
MEALVRSSFDIDIILRNVRIANVNNPAMAEAKIKSNQNNVSWKFPIGLFVL